MLSILRTCVSLVALWALGMATAHAQFLIVPKGERAGSVAPKALKAEMHAWGAFATARLELTFATDPNWSDEVDFMMRLPANTEATGFAYWFGDEYVVAKTVEKERALAVYQFITSWRRDPALVEMVGRRQFRVRIAPVDLTKDLRVEIKLAITPTRGALELPLTELIDRQLQSVDLQLTTPAAGWRENWGRAPTPKDGRQVYTFASKPWKPRTNWRASLASRVVASAGRPAQGEGTLLVAYTSAVDQANVRLSAPRGALTHLYPRAIARLRKGQTVTFAARIASGAPESLVLSVGDQKWTQRLPKTPLTPREGVVVWGARHVAALTDRSQIRKWGLWLSIPTKETSWLAVPQAEIEALEDAREVVAARDYWYVVGKYGAASARAKQALAAFDKLMRDHSPQDKSLDRPWERRWRLDQGWWSATDILSKQYALALSTLGARAAKAELFGRALDRLEASVRKHDRDDWRRNLRKHALESAIEDVVDELLGGEEKPPTGNVASRARARLRALAAGLGNRKLDFGELPHTLTEYAVKGEQRDAKDPYVKLQPFDGERISVARSLLPLFGPAARYRRDAAEQAALAATDYVFWDWHETPKGDKRKPVSDLIRRLDENVARYRIAPKLLESHIVEFASYYLTSGQSWDERRKVDPVGLRLDEPTQAFAAHFGVSPTKILWNRYNGLMYEARWTYVDLYFRTIRDPKELTAARAKLDAWCRALQQPILRDSELHGVASYHGDARNKFVSAYRALGPEDTKTLSARKAMEADDSKSGRAYRTPHRAQILMDEIELDKLMWRDLTPEEKVRRAELEAEVKQLRARMGDPLIVVDAPRDAKVSARLPDGRVVRLTWNPHTMRWEHRFDLPPGVREGTLTLPIWVRTPDGQTEARAMRLQVDQTAPALKATWTRTPTGWRLEALTGADVARVDVALPDGRRLPLQRLGATTEGVRWSAEISGALAGEAIVVATDGAHNRSEARTCLAP